MSQRPAFPGGPRWEPPGDLFGLVMLGIFAGIVIVLVRSIAPH